MRINLVTPFADKDKAKALGARWDAARKIWYIVDVADLTPFMRWIPDLDAASATDGNQAPQGAKPAAKAAAPAATTKSLKEVPSCGCKALPWEDCAHTATKVLHPTEIPNTAQHNAL